MDAYRNAFSQPGHRCFPDSRVQDIGMTADGDCFDSGLATRIDNDDVNVGTRQRRAGRGIERRISVDHQQPVGPESTAQFAERVARIDEVQYRQ